jgi:hypothetical protein
MLHAKDWTFPSIEEINANQKEMKRLNDQVIKGINNNNSHSDSPSATVTSNSSSSDDSEQWSSVPSSL